MVVLVPIGHLLDEDEGKDKGERDYKVKDEGEKSMKMKEVVDGARKQVLGVIKERTGEDWSVPGAIKHEIVNDPYTCEYTPFHFSFLWIVWYQL